MASGPFDLLTIIPPVLLPCTWSCLVLHWTGIGHCSLNWPLKGTDASLCSCSKQLFGESASEDADDSQCDPIHRRGRAKSPFIKVGYTRKECVRTRRNFSILLPLTCFTLRLKGYFVVQGGYLLGIYQHFNYFGKGIITYLLLINATNYNKHYLMYY